MGRGGPIYLSYTAFVLLSAASTANAGLWDVDIDLGPAPSPQDGPPFSAHASRNRDLLPYQIIGIVGAYLGVVLVAYILLFTVGRKLRKRAQSMAERPTELVRPIAKTFDRSPISPLSTLSAKIGLRSGKPGSMRSVKSGISNINSPVAGSVVSFDRQVIEQNKQKQQDALSKLYGAVYEFDDHKSQQDLAASGTQPTSSSQYSRGNLPPIATRNDLYRVQTSDSYPQSPYSPITPTSPAVRAIYPPFELHPSQSSMVAVQPPPPTPQNREERSSHFSSSSNSGTKKLRKGVRGLTISSPMQVRADNSDGARTPLSPGTFDREYPAETPGTARSTPFPDDIDGHHEQLDEIRNLPNPFPQRIASLRNEEIKTISPKRSAVNVNNTLPFRQIKQAQQRSAFPTSPVGSWNFNVTQSASGLLSPSSRTPTEQFANWTGGDNLAAPYTGCATPYSPYMPRILLTPMTPHLQTKAERKQQQKEDKAIRGAITEEDRVADEKDLWRSPYA